MTQKREIYQCQICGNMIMILKEGKGQLVCCNQPMKKLVENTTDAAQEKHIPVLEKEGEAYIIKVGSVKHPMEEKHFIEWIELLTEDLSCIAFLHPGQAPQAIFTIKTEKKPQARAFCNLHGLWKGE